MKPLRPRAKRPLQWLILLSLVLSCRLALALGLGDIQVLSRPGEPLVAQIPIVSGDPSDVEQLRVSLAPNDVFQRVGLEPPTAPVTTLKFSFAHDAQGRELVWVTSPGPINQRSLTFLIVAEWPQGRLVREYSALIDAPGTLDATQGAPNPVADGPPSQAAPVPAAPTPAPAANSPQNLPPAANAPSAITFGGAPMVPSTATASPVDYSQEGAVVLEVTEDQTLSEIAQELARETNHTLDQAMLALLRTNPKAFIKGNINQLKQGAVLRSPSTKTLSAVTAKQASAMVRQHMSQWERARAPIPVPAEGVDAPQVAATTPPSSASPPSAKNSPADDRLEIAPAVANQQQRAGKTTGTSASKEGGDMQGDAQTQQMREDLASRQAELDELRSRIGELEGLKQQQLQLLALKDSELAAANAQLAQSTSNTPIAMLAAHWPWLVCGLVLVFGIAFALRASRRQPVALSSSSGMNGLDFSMNQDPSVKQSTSQQSSHVLATAPIPSSSATAQTKTESQPAASRQPESPLADNGGDGRIWMAFAPASSKSATPQKSSSSKPSPDKTAPSSGAATPNASASVAAIVPEPSSAKGPAATKSDAAQSAASSMSSSSSSRHTNQPSNPFAPAQTSAKTATADAPADPQGSDSPGAAAQTQPKWMKSSNPPSPQSGVTKPSEQGDASVPKWMSALKNVKNTADSGSSRAANAVMSAKLPAPAAPEDRLDLARAYLELGNVDGAKDILNEVASLGDARVRARAQDLLKRIK